MNDITQHKYSQVVSETDIQRFEHPDRMTQADVSFYQSNVQPRLYQIAIMVSEKKPEKDIMSFIGCTEQQFYLYKKYYPEFSNAVAQGKFSMLTKMENALEELATGAEYEETETVNIYEPRTDDVTGETKMVIVQKKERVTKKQTPPNARAIEMWLTNKDPANWKRSQPDNLTQNNTATVINVSDKDMKDFLASFQQSLIQDTRKPAEIVDVEVEHE